MTAYAVPFYFEENAHLNAIAKTAAGVETVVTLTNHTGAGNENGGTVRTAVAVPTTSTLTIYREVPFTQTTSYEENDAFPAASHEKALDKLTTITQQLERRITNCIRGTEATPLSPIPSPTGTQQFVLSAAANQPPSWQELPVLAAGPVVATGSTQARFISDRFADVVNVKDFGAVGDGVADDTAAVLSALQSGSPVDGGGLTYAVSGTLQPTSFVGLRNANFVQLSPATASVATLYIYALSHWFIENCRFDMGSVTNTESADDSGKSALRVRNADGSYCENFRISGVTVTGNGSGSRIQVRQSKRFTIAECLVHDCVAGFTPDPTNDIMNGFDIGDCADFSISNCNVYNLKSIIAGVESNRYTRGFLFTEIRDCTIIGCNSTFNDQAYDFSGAVITGTTPAYYEGNRRFTISGCTANNAGTWGFKFANVTHDGLVTGCIANNSGSGGFVFSAPNASSTAIKYATGNIDIVGCKVVNVLNNGGAGVGISQGFRVMAGNIAYGTTPNTFNTYPRGVRFKSCEVIDNQVTPTTLAGFISDVAVIQWPDAGYNTNIANTAISCSVGPGVTTALSGIGPNVCVSTSSTTQSIVSAVWTNLNWDIDFSDNTGLHSVTSNTDSFYIKESGFYRIFSRTQFAPNATGTRMARISLNGNAIDRTTVIVNALTAIQPTTVATEIIRNLSSGDIVRIQVYQDSGGALNALTNEGLFMVNKLD